MWKNGRFSAVFVLFQSTRLVLLVNAMEALYTPSSLSVGQFSGMLKMVS